MEKIYIILTHTGTALSRIIKYYTKDEFSHVSIALDSELKEMYSFGRLHPYNAFWGSFVHEEINKGTFKRFKKTKAEIYSLLVTDEQYEKAKKTITYFNNNKQKYKLSNSKAIHKDKKSHKQTKHITHGLLSSLRRWHSSPLKGQVDR